MKQWTGIPVSIGIGPTKTLAKIANRLAKKSPRAGGGLDLVGHPEWIEAALRRTDVGDVWGIGRQWNTSCLQAGIRTVWDLAHKEDGWVRKTMGNVGLRTALELRGRPVHTLEMQPATRHSCCCSRTFGEATASRQHVQDAFLYRKAGVLLLDLANPATIPRDLFSPPPDSAVVCQRRKEVAGMCWGEMIWMLVSGQFQRRGPKTRRRTSSICLLMCAPTSLSNAINQSL